jgi:hypothetical protein
MARIDLILSARNSLISENSAAAFGANILVQSGAIPPELAAENVEKPIEQNPTRSNWDELDFRSFDDNGDGYIDFNTEFVPHINKLLEKYDFNHDRYISNGRGRAWYYFWGKEDGIDELASFIKDSKLPYESDAMSNTTLWGKGGNSFLISECYTAFHNDYASYAWKKLAGMLPVGKVGGALSLKQAVDANGWLKVSSGDRAIVADGRWDKFERADLGSSSPQSSLEVAHDGTIDKKDKFQRLLWFYVGEANSKHPLSKSPSLGLLTDQAQADFAKDTGIRFYSRDQDGRLVTPAQNLYIRDVIKDDYKIPDPNCKLKDCKSKENWTFRELYGYPDK